MPKMNLPFAPSPQGPSRQKFIIYAGSFDPQIGGAVALHQLCHLLRRQGCEAYVWPAARPCLAQAQGLDFGKRWKQLRYVVRRKEARYQTWPEFDTPVAQKDDLADAIAVYPEVVDGNPLHAKHVVRWLLHKPGFFTGRVDYQRSDRFFFYSEAFDDPAWNDDRGNLLRTPAFAASFYRQTNFGPRQGSCYMLRKGKGRPVVHDLTDSVCVDDLTHEQMAEVFNRARTFISYDPYTMYSVFAAMCGCISVVVPEAGVTMEHWLPDPSDRHGIAYGFEDTPRAVATQSLVTKRLQAMEDDSTETVRHFIAQCAKYFPP